LSEAELNVETDWWNRCDLHGDPYQKDTVIVLYGLWSIDTSAEYVDAWRKDFKRANPWDAGGCSVTAGRPAARESNFCPTCRRNEIRWLSEYVRRPGVNKEGMEWFVAGLYGLVRDESLVTDGCGGLSRELL
jgi:hypothetical protein